MGIFTDNIRIGYQSEEIIHFCPAIVQYIPDRVLHKGIGNENPESGEVRAESHQPNANAVLLLTEFIPTEHPDT